MSGGWARRVALLSRSAPLAVALLILANLVPLVGVLYFDWSVATILYAYWLENGIVGLLNVPRILLAAGSPRPGESTSINFGVAGRVGMAAFFLVHYGLFWVVHGVFVTVLTGNRLGGFDFGDPLRVVFSDSGLMLAAAALLISHAASFWLNYIGRGEYRTMSVGGQMFAPYPRMFVLHTAIVFGAAIIIGAQQPELFVVLLVVLKTGADLFLHLREHAARAAPAQSVSSPIV